MGKKHKKICTTLICIEHFLILVFGCIWISAFASLVVIPIEITSSAAELQICSISP